MIQLTETTSYNPELPLDEQLEVQEIIAEVMQQQPEVIMEGIRPKKVIYAGEGFKVVVTYKYKNPVTHAENFTLAGETITIQEA